MVLSMDRWRGKVAIVSGASSGIGMAVADMLLKHGMIVIGLARRAHIIETHRAVLCAPDASRLHAIACDMRVDAEIIAAIAECERRFGPVSILVNSAGVAFDTTLSDGDAQQWRDVLETNVLGVCVATREAVRQMKAHAIDGHIVHVSSVLGHYVAMLPNINVYSASKHAVRALVETLRQELLHSGTGIRISSVSPGPVDTEFFKNIVAPPNFPKLLAEDVADAVEYVLSTAPHVQVQDVMLRPLGEPV